MACFEFAICGQMGRVMSADSPTFATRPPATRSRVTNGRQLLPMVDGRSIWARRMRDLMELHLDDLGGAENTSEAERSIVRRVAVADLGEDHRLAVPALHRTDPLQMWLPVALHCLNRPPATMYRLLS